MAGINTSTNNHIMTPICFVEGSMTGHRERWTSMLAWCLLCEAISVDVLKGFDTLTKIRYGDGHGFKGRECLLDEYSHVTPLLNNLVMARDGAMFRASSPVLVTALAS
jgi:hypothetical protein